MSTERLGEDIRSLEELWKLAADGYVHEMTPREEMFYSPWLVPPRWHYYGPDYYRSEYEARYPKIHLDNRLVEWDY